MTEPEIEIIDPATTAPSGDLQAQRDLLQARLNSAKLICNRALAKQQMVDPRDLLKALGQVD